jgi:hypothetical protein
MENNRNPTNGLGRALDRSRQQIRGLYPIKWVRPRVGRHHLDPPHGRLGDHLYQTRRVPPLAVSAAPLIVFLAQALAALRRGRPRVKRSSLLEPPPPRGRPQKRWWHRRQRAEPGPAIGRFTRPWLRDVDLPDGDHQAPQTGDYGARRLVEPRLAGSAFRSVPGTPSFQCGSPIT